MFFVSDVVMLEVCELWKDSLRGVTSHLRWFHLNIQRCVDLLYTFLQYKISTIKKLLTYYITTSGIFFSFFLWPQSNPNPHREILTVMISLFEN